jgi:class 3 adenylate cyclase|tara:strand:+ start:247 stop:1485 length:1239 start_codon:yes stop_codon:yes gene_type:complete
MIDEIGHRDKELLMEEIVSNLLHQVHVVDDAINPESIHVYREKDLGFKDKFADIYVTRTGHLPYVAEVKLGHSPASLLHQLRRKYEGVTPGTLEKAIVVVYGQQYSNWEQLASDIHAIFPSSMTVEIWDEAKIARMIKTYCDIEIQEISADLASTLRQRLDASYWNRAAGTVEQNTNESELEQLPSTLLWHLGPWTLQRLAQDYGSDPETVLRYGRYPQVAVVMADLCGFSGYVKDTPDDEIMRNCLTRFYSQSRQAIHDNGGFFYQFVGDAVVAMFGVPQRFPGYTLDALRCAVALTDIGQSVSQQWQRHLDRVQTTSGVRVGIALGDTSMIPYRPYSSTHVGFIGDTINMAARLGSVIHPRGVLVANSFYMRLDIACKNLFEPFETVEAKNVGNIQCWRLEDFAIPDHPE